MIPEPAADEFECEDCHDIMDIEDSIATTDGKLVCPACAENRGS